MGLVVSHAIEDRSGMSGGLDVLNVQLFEGVDVLHDGVELGLKLGDLLVAQFEPGETRHIADIELVLRHGRETCHSRRDFQAQFLRIRGF